MPDSLEEERLALLFGLALAMECKHSIVPRMAFGLLGHSPGRFTMAQLEIDLLNAFLAVGVRGWQPGRIGTP